MTANQLRLSESSDNQIMIGADGFVLLPKISCGVLVQGNVDGKQQSTLKTELSSLSLKVNDTKLPPIYSTAAGGCLCGCPNYIVHMQRLSNRRYKLQLGAQIYNKT